MIWQTVIFCVLLLIMWTIVILLVWQDGREKKGTAMKNNDLISRSALLEQMHNHYEVRNPKQNATMDECCMMVIHAPAVDAETVFQHLDLMQEAFEMAKADLVPVVRCKDCKHYRTHGDIRGLCYYGTGMRFMYNDGFCSYGERRMVTDKIEIEIVDILRGDLKGDGGHPDPVGALGEPGVDGIDVSENGSADDA